MGTAQICFGETVLCLILSPHPGFQAKKTLHVDPESQRALESPLDDWA